MNALTVLVLWLSGVTLIQLLQGGWLGAAVAVCVAAAAWAARPRLLRLLRRVRILLLAIVVLFAWFTPGEAALIGWPALSPTREGLLLAMEHVGRLVGVVCCVTLLLDVLTPNRLVGGVHALCRPLALIGVPPERLALRILLVLHYVEHAGGEHARDWKAWLTGDDHDDGTVLTLSREAYGAWDLAAFALLVLAGLIWWGTGAWR